MIKKLLLILILSFSINVIATSNSSANKYGNGELKLSPQVVEWFIYYIRGKQSQYPSIFYVTLDGTDATYWYCPERTNCQSGAPSRERAVCLQQTGKECRAFARQRTVKWKNDLNPGKGKISQINSRWTDQRWIIIFSKKKGDMTVKEKEHNNKVELIDKAKSNQVYIEVKKKFSDANLIDVSSKKKQKD